MGRRGDRDGSGDILTGWEGRGGGGGWLVGRGGDVYIIMLSRLLILLIICVCVCVCV